MLPTPFQRTTSQTRFVSSISHDIILFFKKNLIFQYTNPLAFETKAHSIHTTPLLRLFLENIYILTFLTLDIKHMKSSHHKRIIQSIYEKLHKSLKPF